MLKPNSAKITRDISRDTGNTGFLSFYLVCPIMNGSQTEPKIMSCHDSELILTGRRLRNVGVVIYIPGDIQALHPVVTPDQWCPVSPDLVTLPRRAMEREI